MSAPTTDPAAMRAQPADVGPADGGPDDRGPADCGPCRADPVAGLFASRSVAAHVVRGVLGLVLAVTAFALAGQQPAALLLLIPALVAWRGCPTCWLMGLAETRRRTS